MSNNGQLRGILELDSPQLFGTCKRTFAKDTCDLLAVVYHTVWAFGGCKEDTPRAAGVSYNPKPARICSLIIQDAECKDCDLLSIAMFSCLDHEAISSLHIQVDPSILKNASLIIDKVVPPSPYLEPVYLAHDVDTLRHLHLFKKTAEETKDILEGIHSRAKMYHQSATRLYSIFTSTLDRYLD